MNKKEISKMQAIVCLHGLLENALCNGDLKLAFNGKLYMVDKLVIKKLACQQLDRQAFAILSSWLA